MSPRHSNATGSNTTGVYGNRMQMQILMLEFVQVQCVICNAQGSAAHKDRFE